MCLYCIQVLCRYTLQFWFYVLVCLFTCMFITCMFIYFYVYLLVCSFTCMFIYLHVYLLVCLFNFMFIKLVCLQRFHWKTNEFLYTSRKVESEIIKKKNKLRSFIIYKFCEILFIFFINKKNCLAGLTIWNACRLCSP